jgi:pilus assembly protein CpaE
MGFRSGQQAARSLSILAATPDAEFADCLRKTFGSHPQIALEVVDATAASVTPEKLTADVCLIDIASDEAAGLRAIQTLMSSAQPSPPIIVVTQNFDADIARAVLQMRAADFLVKPIPPIELVRACARVTKAEAARPAVEAKIYTFLPASGGAGVTTLAIQTAMLLLNSRSGRSRPSTCIVDLDFQHGAVADYLDVEPRLNLGEVEPRPDRLDRQLLEVMLSQHASGLSVIAAPNRPAEMRSFDPEVVTRLLDLVAGHFEYVVFDMPRTWFSWTDGVLLGSDHLFVVSEATVPGLRHARQLVAAVKERFDGCADPRVIVNRFQEQMFSAGLRRADIEQALGGAFASSIPNDYSLVREAIDRGVPLEEVRAGNKIAVELRKLIMPKVAPAAAQGRATQMLGKLGLSFAR